MKQSIYKVPDGKLLKIFLEDQSGLIRSIRITGDFFMHPEEKISVLEDSLLGLELNEKIITNRLSVVLNDEKIEIFGADPISIAHAIMLACNPAPGEGNR